MSKQMEKILGGKTAIRNNANAFTLRAAQAPLLDKDKQPVIYAMLEKIAKKEGLTPEQYQELMDGDFL